MILLRTMPRSRSSMCAKIFHYHGVWVGDCASPRSQQPDGFFENVIITSYLVRLYGKKAAATERTVPRISLRTFLADSLAPPEPWLYKSTALMSPALYDVADHIVNIRRQRADCVESCRRTNWLATGDVGQLNRIYDANQSIMDEGGLDLDTDRIVAGDYAQLEQVMGACGLPMNEALVRGIVH